MVKKVVIRDDQVVELALDVILPGDNDREDFEEGGLVELAQSIMECGLAQPITVRPIALTPNPSPIGRGGLYQIVAGERRWRAHQVYTDKVRRGEWKESAKCRPGFVRALVRNLSDEEASKIMLAENDQRQDLKPLERAKAYQKRIDQFGWSVEQLAEAVKKGVRTVRIYLDLLQLEPYVQKAANDGDLPLGHAQLMAPLDANRQRMAMRLLAKGERVTYEMFREYVGQLLEEQSQRGMFDLTAFWVEQVNEAEAKRQGICYDLPMRDDLPEVVVEPKDNASQVIRRYIIHLAAAGYEAEAGAIGTLMTVLLKRRKIKS